MEARVCVPPPSTPRTTFIVCLLLRCRQTPAYRKGVQKWLRRRLWYLSRMTRRNFFFAALLLVFAAALTPAQNPAPTPPMGWNSWDAYGLTINEADFRANVKVLAGFKDLGWQYAVIDEGWYMENPFGSNLAERKYLLDGNGILIPVASRFPSSADGVGFKPLAAWVHKQGLKFGIHIVRGIPKQAVKDNLPIAGSKFHAADAADTMETCPRSEEHTSE